MRHLLLTLAACLFAGAPLWGGDYPKTEVFGSAGWAHWWDNQGGPVSGLIAGGAVGRRLLPQFALEFEALGFSGTRAGTAFGPDNRARGVQVSANGVLYVYQRPRMRVFILLGAGGSYATSETTFGDYHDTRSRAGFIANAGTGIELFLTDHIALRPEVRFQAGHGGSASSDPFTGQVHAALGIGYHW